ncbi:MAG: twin-arginine translocase subunit TatC [Acidobacteriales bacterium]|nr:twin-arginine translocase subunit TatC [Terriglobales bacterium]
MPESAVDRVREAVTERAELPNMSLLEHLEELRKRVIHASIGIAVGFAACWGLWRRIFDVMQQPVFKAMSRNHVDPHLVYTNPLDPFNLQVKIAFVAGIFLSCPWVLYQVWQFISPALYRHEKRYALPFLVSTVGLFLAGGFFGYYLVYPQALTFLIHQGTEIQNAQAMITINEYVSLFMTIELGLGLVFELPILIFFLALMGIVDARFLTKNFRYAVLIMFIIAAILTPTPDVMSMTTFAAPMILLYIIGIGIAYLVHPKRRKARAQA